VFLLVTSGLPVFNLLTSLSLSLSLSHSHSSCFSSSSLKRHFSITVSLVFPSRHTYFLIRRPDIKASSYLPCNRLVLRNHIVPSCVLFQNHPSTGQGRPGPTMGHLKAKRIASIQRLKMPVEKLRTRQKDTISSSRQHHPRQCTLRVWPFCKRRCGLYANIFSVLLVFFVSSLEQQTNSSLFIYVLSLFSQHPAIAYIGMAVNILSGLVNIVYTNSLKGGSYFTCFFSVVLVTSIGTSCSSIIVQILMIVRLCY
jgi:hypothetical protein